MYLRLIEGKLLKITKYEFIKFVILFQNTYIFAFIKTNVLDD